MVGKNNKIKKMCLVLSLAMLPVSGFALEQSRGDLGEDLNRLVFETVRVVGLDGANKPIQIGGKKEGLYKISDYIGEGERANVEELNFELKRVGMVNRIRKGEMTALELQKEFMESQFPIVSVFEPALLPYREVEMEPKVRATITSPVAIVGYDEISMEWLELNQPELSRLGASVILASAENVAEYLVVRRAANGLKVIPMNADYLLNLTGVKAYPILLTSSKAFQ
ncbi:DUF2859 domain-containing protein [Vibrio barjaei]|uniref:DUF2859 domain-containing protein n=1 Tax=Vibrio barjaei TaxID=1676683 RepID=UPI0022850C6A|nr:DUF2859 domain-containing protein [Vibrio barjaei]MCY9874543.1 DUF2859 domain-containing protein [Vibrio barjaei]